MSKEKLSVSEVPPPAGRSETLRRRRLEGRNAPIVPTIDQRPDPVVVPQQVAVVVERPSAPDQVVSPTPETQTAPTPTPAEPARTPVTALTGDAERAHAATSATITAYPAPIWQGRALAVPLHREVVKKQTTFATSVAMVDALHAWRGELRARGEQRPSVVEFVTAAFIDLPRDIDEMRDLTRSYPADIYDGGRDQLSGRLPAEIVRIIRDVHEIIRESRTKPAPGWEVLAAAMKRQLDTEIAARQNGAI